jgi:hypothetical protein
MASLIGELERTANARTARQQAFDQLRGRGLSGFVRGNGRGDKSADKRKPDARKAWPTPQDRGMRYST